MDFDSQGYRFYLFWDVYELSIVKDNQGIVGHHTSLRTAVEFCYSIEFSRALPQTEISALSAHTNAHMNTRTRLRAETRQHNNMR